jgi:hypothetical protein
MDWAFFRVEVPAPHAKPPAGDKHHSLRRRFHDVRPPSDEDPSAHVHYILPAWHAAAGWILGGRNIVDAFLQAQSREPSQRDSSTDSNAETSAAVHRAPLHLRKPTNALYGAFAGFS